MSKLKAITVSVMLLLGAGSEGVYAGADDLRVDEEGRSFRTRFDPGRQISLGLLSGAAWAEAGWGDSQILDLAIDWRSQFDFGRGDDSIVWQLDHRLVRGWIAPWQRGVGQSPRLDLTAYGLTFLRHAEAPYLTWPASPPKRIFFPFDIGVDMAVGHIRLSDDALRVGVARAAILLDPWRSGRAGNSLEIGLGMRYDLDIRRPARSDQILVHRLAPFSAVSARFRWQDLDGLTRLDTRAEVFPHWASNGRWGTGVLGALRFERVLVALNDEPLAAVIQADYSLDPAVAQASPEHELRLTAGLSFGWQLK